MSNIAAHSQVNLYKDELHSWMLRGMFFLQCVSLNQVNEGRFLHQKAGMPKYTGFPFALYFPQLTYLLLFLCLGFLLSFQDEKYAQCILIEDGRDHHLTIFWPQSSKAQFAIVTRNSTNQIQENGEALKKFMGNYLLILAFCRYHLTLLTFSFTSSCESSGQNFKSAYLSTMEQKSG